MCGIAGVINNNQITDEDINTVRNAIMSIRHRGPDYCSVVERKNACIGHTLLSIIDVGNGQQPITNENKRIWLSYNGEVYNYIELRKLLESRGRQFQTNTDTEVVLFMYEEFGEEFVHHLNGMFSIAVWDEINERLLLVRDRLGVKPLYYLHQRSRLFFASELKAISGQDSFIKKFDLSALGNYLSFKYLGNTQTMFEGVHKLRPGHYAIFQNDKLTVKRYWAPIPRNVRGDPNLIIPNLLSDATAIRLRSDVPLSVSLSGGIDSSVVLYEAVQSSAKKVTAFSVRYPGHSQDESIIASNFARSLGVDHHIVDFPKLDTNNIAKLAMVMDEPCGDYSAYPSYELFKAQKNFSTVVLGGDGGDEAFGGYKRYSLFNRISQFNKYCKAIKHLNVFPFSGLLTQRMARAIEYLGLNATERYYKILSSMDRIEQQFLLGKNINLPNVIDLGWNDKEFERMSRLPSLYDYEMYLPGVLMKVDRTSMAHSVEVRSPFLDYRVVEYGISLHQKKCYNGSSTKLSLREAYRNKLPNEILDGKKRGFTVPPDYWDNQDFRDYANDILSAKPLKDRGIFCTKAVSKLLDDWNKGENKKSRSIWTILMFELWCMHYLS